MKKKFLKGMALLMAFTIIFVSCTKDLRVADAIEKVRLAEMQIEMQNSMSIVWDAANTTDANLESVVQALNDYGVEKYGETIISYEEFKSTLEHYRPYMTEEIKQDNMFDIFLEEGKLTQEQYNLLIELDRKMTKSENDNSAISILNAFEDDVREHITLTSNEKNQLLVFNEGVKAQYEFVAATTNTDKNACTDCLLKKKWKIFGWAAGLLVLGLVICILTGPAFVICVAGIGLAWLGQIMIHCPACIGL